MYKLIKQMVFVVFLALPLGSAGAQTLTMGTLPQGSVGNAIGSAIGNVAGDQGMRMRVVPQGGPEVILPGVNRGSFDLTVTPSIPTYLAYRGEALFDGKPQENVRVLAALFPLMVGFVVPADSDIRTIEDLRGKRVSSGFPRQRPLLMMLRASLATAGMDMSDVEEVLVPDGVRGLDELASGNVDAAIFSVGSGRVAQTDATVRGGIRFLPINDGEEAERAMQAIAPSSYAYEVQPQDGRPGVMEPTPILTSSMLLVGGARMSDEQVTKLLEIVVDRADDIANIHGAFRGFDPDAMYRDFGAPYHPAALAFYRERGLVD